MISCQRQELVKRVKIFNLETKRLKKLFTDLKNSEEYVHFIYPVDLELFPTYRDEIPNMIYLNLILKRLDSGYYRRIQSVWQDFNQLRVNAMNFNDPIESPLYEFAKKDMLEVLNSICDSPSNIVDKIGKDEDFKRESPKVVKKIEPLPRVLIKSNSRWLEW